MRVNVTDHVDSAHHLIGHGRCERPHGHTYRVDLVFDQAEAVDFASIKLRLKEVLGPWDHIDLNDKLVFPSCENICIAMFRDLQKSFSSLQNLRVWEGHGKWAHVQLGDVELKNPKAGELLAQPGETVRQQLAGIGDE